MKIGDFRNANGFISAHEIQGIPTYDEKTRSNGRILKKESCEDHPDVIKMCLNCEKEKCKGYCKDVTRLIADIKRKKKEEKMNDSRKKSAKRNNDVS